MDLNTIRNLVKADLAATDQLIDECLSSRISLIKELSTHLIYSGGKRLRPLVVLLSAKAFNYTGHAHIELAASLELVHTATLLHDDVVDMSDLRRGKKTANVIWGNAASILVGDFLYSRAFQLMVRADNMQVMEILSRATNTIAEGEILQLLHCKNPATDEACCLEIIRAKTGTLFATAACIGAVIAGCEQAIIDRMQNYGMYLGTAFQLVDDALDYHASSETLGKNRGDDLAEGKPTVPLITALQHCTPTQKEIIRTAIQNPAQADREQIFAIIESTAAISYTYDLAQKHAKQAIDELMTIPASPYRDALCALTEFALERSY